ncbi:unnamed protein product, partial [Ectocarpus fasciculatus]
SPLLLSPKVHREEGLELHLELISKQRGSARAGTKTAAMQEEMAALCSKLSATNARLVIAENSKAKLEQELASEKEHEKQLVAWRKQLDDLRESKEEEAGKSAFEISRLKADLEIAHQKASE